MIDQETARIFDRRSALFLGAGAVLTSALVLRMFQMQVFEYGDYKRRAENNSYRVRVDLPQRGRILSGNGTPISRDMPIYRIYIIPEETDDLDGLIETAASDLGLRKKRVDRIWRTVKKQRAFQPVLVSENSDWEKLARLNARNLSGLHIEGGFARNYILGAAGAQVFGYTGAPSSLPPGSSPFFTTGITGLERTFENTLAGTPGQTVMVTNAVGRVTGEDPSRQILPVSGQDLHTTIRDNVQKKLYDAIAVNRAGCGVAMDVHSGEILAMVSAPSFDPGMFRRDDGEEYMAGLVDDFAGPFVNKAVEGLYPPGSTFKIVVALAALEAGAITTTEKIYCPGYWEYGNHRYHCWEKDGHGWEDLAGALAHSCDVYFYQVALRIGIDSVNNMAIKLGLGTTFMRDVFPKEMLGIIPDRKWKEKNTGARWVHGDTIISGIGQGFILTNCLQLCTMTARAVTNTKVSPLLMVREEKQKAENLGLQKKNIDAVKKGLERVTMDGGTASGSRINVNGQKMGGKTGTSQVRNISAAERKSGVLDNEQLSWSKRNHGLFVGYAPTDNPRYAVCVIMEHSGGSGGAARAVAETMKELLKE